MWIKDTPWARTTVGSISAAYWKPILAAILTPRRATIAIATVGVPWTSWEIYVNAASRVAFRARCTSSVLGAASVQLDSLLSLFQTKYHARRCVILFFFFSSFPRDQATRDKRDSAINNRISNCCDRFVRIDLVLVTRISASSISSYSRNPRNDPTWTSYFMK